MEAEQAGGGEGGGSSEKRIPCSRILTPKPYPTSQHMGYLLVCPFAMAVVAWLLVEVIK